MKAPGLAELKLFILMASGSRFLLQCPDKIRRACEDSQKDWPSISICITYYSQLVRAQRQGRPTANCSLLSLVRLEHKGPPIKKSPQSGPGSASSTPGSACKSGESRFWMTWLRNKAASIWSELDPTKIKNKTEQFLSNMSQQSICWIF